MLLIHGGTIVDADGALDADVAVEDGEIVGVGDVDVDPRTAEATVDATGQYVTPGLIDSHVHLMMDGRADAASVSEESVPTLAFNVAANLRAALRAGVTTVRDLGAVGTLGTDAARAVADGTLAGPRVYASAENITMTGGHGHWFGREADGPAEVRKAAREQLKRGAEVIKCMATGGVLTPGAETGAPELAAAELEAIVDVAAAKGVPTAAHAHGAAGIKNAVRAGITSIEHGTFMDGEAAAMMTEAGTYWVPTASALHAITDAGSDAGIPEYAIEKAEEAAGAFDRAFENALDAGVSVAMGTDAGTPFNYHADAARELEYMVEHGLSETDALEAATVNAADLLGIPDVGMIEAGYRADLLVIPDDPRTDVTAWQRPETVLAAGTPVAEKP